MNFRPEKIRELRMRHGHSLGTMSRLLKARCDFQISRSSLSQWERGNIVPGIEALLALCRLYSVEPNYFFSIDKLPADSRGNREGNKHEL
jgi:transcriptional regulator with XRE-family HTH domain